MTSELHNRFGKRCATKLDCSLKATNEMEENLTKDGRRAPNRERFVCCFLSLSLSLLVSVCLLFLFYHHLRLRLDYLRFDVSQFLSLSLFIPMITLIKIPARLWILFLSFSLISFWWHLSLVKRTNWIIHLMWTCRVSLSSLEWDERNRTRSILGTGNDGDLLDWYPSQVKGPVDDEVQEGKGNPHTLDQRRGLLLFQRIWYRRSNSMKMENYLPWEIKAEELSSFNVNNK